MSEGPLYEPWNQTTLDKLSSEGTSIPPLLRSSLLFSSLLFSSLLSSTLRLLFSSPYALLSNNKFANLEAPPATKVTRAIYRYGPIAGKILLRRFGHLCTQQEMLEIERILNFGSSNNTVT